MGHPKDIPDINTQDLGQSVGTPEIENPLTGIAQRFIDFCKRFAAPFLQSNSLLRTTYATIYQWINTIRQTEPGKNVRSGP